MPKCIYCREDKPFTDEHVLTRAFAGQGENWTLQDIVCGDCNAAFSLYERAWTSSPGEAIARIFHGPAGRKRKGHSYRVHPAEHIYMVKDDDPIAYEAEILEGFEPRLRPQFIWTGADMLALAPNVESAPRLAAAFNAFIQQRELTVLSIQMRQSQRDSWLPNLVLWQDRNPLALSDMSGVTNQPLLGLIIFQSSHHEIHFFAGLLLIKTIDSGFVPRT